MVQVVIGVGSNVAREKNICSALDQLHNQFGDLSISSVYQSSADLEGSFSDSQDRSYYNLVVAVDTDLSVQGVKALLRAVENVQERARQSAEVTLDLDLLLYGDWLGELDGNAVPHHDITECAYVLRPLTDLLPSYSHPVYNKTIIELWDSFSEKHGVYPVDFIWNKRLISQAVVNHSF